MLIKSMIAALLMVGLLGASAIRAEEATLKPGDPAPALQVGKWVKGEPVKEFARDKIYIVEFWATWCPPCRASIPHLTELQKKYADKAVVCIGQDLDEPEDKVVPFVEKMGDKMDYRVAVDADGAMGKAWFKAAGQNGIPCAFIVNKETKVVWIGHPMEMDKVLEQVVAGTWDLAKAVEESKKAEAAAAVQQKLSRQLGEAANARDWKKFVEIVDAAIKENPDMGLQLQFPKFHGQLELGDLDAAYATAGKIGDDPKASAQMLNAIAWTILDKKDLARRDFDLALKLAEKANEATKGADAAILDTLARAHFEKGNVDKAIELQTRAVEKAPEEMKKGLEESLKKYQDKKAK
ncbi:MAG: redoxin domain-containing protein [Tepidisphaeraceae bacterium]